VADRLRCPNCAAAFALDDRALVCATGHRFDLARQGYVSLLPPRGRHPSGDTAAMVEARERFLGRGHFAPIADALPQSDGLVVELGAGTAYYLAAVATGHGLALDASKAALRRVKRFAAVACDVWLQIPLQDGVADLVLDVFAPRNGPEIARVLAPSGTCVVVTPTPDHLLELRRFMLDVDPRKPERLVATMQPLRHVDHRRLDFTMTLVPDDVRALIGMGPSAHHVDVDALALPEQTEVTGSVSIDTFRRGSQSPPR
jgi:23S rRNA (guanine745-N1)-methyltransferase